MPEFLPEESDNNVFKDKFTEIECNKKIIQFLNNCNGRLKVLHKSGSDIVISWNAGHFIEAIEQEIEIK